MHISQWIILPTQSCLALYSFCANLLHSLIMWLMVSSLSPHSLHLLICYVLSMFALIWLVLMALFCAAIRRDSVSIIIILILLLLLLLLLLLIIIIIIIILASFPTSVSWWSLTSMWARPCLLSSQGLFSIYWGI